MELQGCGSQSLTDTAGCRYRLRCSEPQTTGNPARGAEGRRGWQSVSVVRCRVADPLVGGPWGAEPPALETHPSSGPRHRRTPFRPLCRDLEPLSGPWGSHGGQLGVHNNRPVWKPGANTDPGLAPVTCAGPPSRGVTSSPARPEPPQAVGGGGVAVGPTAPQIDSPRTAHLLGLPGRTPILTALTSAHSSDVGRRSEPCGRLRLQAGSPLPGGPSVLSIKNRLQLMGRGSHTAGDACVTQSQASAHKPHPETPSQPHPGRVWPATGRMGWPG